LRKPGKEKEEFLPSFAHAESLVGCVAVLKERLGEQRKVPVQYKKENNENHGLATDRHIPVLLLYILIHTIRKIIQQSGPTMITGAIK
jgi:hypothetical protein